MKKNLTDFYLAGILLMLTSAFSGLILLLGTGFPFWITALISGSGFLVVSLIYTVIRRGIKKKLFVKWVSGKYNSFIHAFTRDIQVSFSINDFINVLKTDIEAGADFSALWIDTETGKTLYASPSAITSARSTADTLNRRFDGKKDGIYNLSDSLHILTKDKAPRGIAFCFNRYRLFLFSRYLDEFDPAMFERAFTTYCRYLERVQTIEKMFSLSAKSKEWELLAETQMSFLPSTLPETKAIEMKSYFRALVNVSGDYYNVLPITEEKTLFFLGDVSGKGLSAALIMGIIMNTIQITANKEDLPALVLNVDAAIKNMDFRGKYTTLFIGLHDCSSGKLRFINAGMPEPILISGQNTEELPGTSCPIGIMPMDDMEEEERTIKPGDFLFIGSDGVTEVMNPEGDQLGDMPQFRELIKKAPNTPLDTFTEELVKLVGDFTRGEALRDDLTFLSLRFREVS